MKRKFWNWIKNEDDLEGVRTLFLDGEIYDETWFNANKALELGFADKILFKDDNKRDKNTDNEEEKDKSKEDEKKNMSFSKDSILFSNKSVSNSFLDKISKEKVQCMIPITQLEKRLNLIKH